MAICEEEEGRRADAFAARDRERLAALRNSAELLRQAEEIRALVVQLRQAVVDGRLDVDSTNVETWERWALAQADELDPLRSGQIMTQLKGASD